MGNRVILQKILTSCGPVFARSVQFARAIIIGLTRFVSQIMARWSQVLKKDNTIWMRGRSARCCRGSEDEVMSVCLTDDKIVSGSGDSIVRVWDMQGKQRALCKGHEVRCF